MNKTFLYFGYGSNLLRQRLQLQNPSAKFVSVGQLKGYMLGFTTFDQDLTEGRWKGGAATIIPTTDEQSVWGCIWKLDHRDMPSLDRQEGAYQPVNVDVTASDGTAHNCRTYIARPNSIHSTFDTRPSPMYLDVILRGAKQNQLPAEYISFLESIETNGNNGECKVYNEVLKLIRQS